MSRKFISTKDESVRMFESSFVEFFSKVHPSVPVIIYAPVVMYLMYISVSVNGISLLKGLLFYLCGFIMWQMLEYTLHRFVFHYQPESEWGKRLHFIIHGVHHDYPSDSKRLVMPPSVSLPLAVFFYFLLTYLAGQTAGYLILSGLITGYLIYDMTHFAIHHFRIKSKFWLAVKKHHMKHHFQDPERGFAISIPLVDNLFGTDYRDK